MVINPLVGVYIPIINIIRFPIKGGMTIPNIATFDQGTFIIYQCSMASWSMAIRFHHGHGIFVGSLKRSPKKRAPRALGDSFYVRGIIPFHSLFSWD